MRKEFLPADSEYLCHCASSFLRDSFSKKVLYVIIVTTSSTLFASKQDSSDNDAGLSPPWFQAHLKKDKKAKEIEFHKSGDLSLIEALFNLPFLSVKNYEKLLCFKCNYNLDVGPKPTAKVEFSTFKNVLQ